MVRCRIQLEAPFSDEVISSLTGLVSVFLFFHDIYMQDHPNGLPLIFALLIKQILNLETQKSIFSGRMPPSLRPSSALAVVAKK